MASRRTEFWKQLQEAKLLVQQATAEADLRRDEFLNRDQRSPDAVYEPTQSSNPNDPRTAAMQYWADEQTLRIEWGDGGTPYLYYAVTKADWRNITRVKSPGRAINRWLNGHPYGPE